MATHRISFGQALVPDTSGSVYWQPASILDTNDKWPTDQVLVFADTSTLLLAYGHVLVPQNYVGTAKIYVIYKTTATSGNTLWTVDYRAVADGESLDQATYQESLAGAATAVPGTTNLRKDISFTLTAANLAAGDVLQVVIGRNGAGADTVAASLQLVDAVLEYADA